MVWVRVRVLIGEQGECMGHDVQHGGEALDGAFR